MLRACLLATIAASLLWGVSATWTAVNRTSATNAMVTTTGPLTFDAQQVYQSLSDADATEAAAFLAVTEPPATQAQFRADIARAGSYLQAVTAAGSTPTTRPDLATLNTEVPAYSLLIGKAQADDGDGLPVGAAYVAEASYLMRTQILPAAGDLYHQEARRLASSYHQATGYPITAMVTAIICATCLLLAQWWLARRTHRLLNPGLLAASLTILLSLAWLIGSFLMARSSLIAANARGAVPEQALVQAQIAVLRGHADESLTLINRGGDDANEADFKQAEKLLGPGTATLLSAAQAASAGSPGQDQAMAAAAAATTWYAVHRAVRALDNSGDYPDAVYLAIGSGPSASPTVIQRTEATLAKEAGPGHPATSASAFQDVEADLTAGISADQAAFTTSASNGDAALDGLVAGMTIAALLMAATSAWGLSRRLAEYR
jgi:hypothetical protein